MSNFADLIFEIGTEELPPKSLKQLSTSLLNEFVSGLDQADLSHGEATAYATPRRLAVYIQNCATQQPDRQIERRGPNLKAAFDGTGTPTKAAEGFARSCGVSVTDLQSMISDQGEWLTYIQHQNGKCTIDLLPSIAETALAKLPIAKRMRWGSSDAEFIRPVHWILFKLGLNVVPCRLFNISASDFTFGHRFHHPQPLMIENPSEYSSRLKDTGYVIPSYAERRNHITSLVKNSAHSLGGFVDLDQDLLDEVTSLNEWPVAIAGSFEPHFLEVPPETLVLTMKQNQKYFPIFDKHSKLMNHFITIANIESPYPDLIREGNERVIRPRLTDAMFFWHNDSKRRLEDHIESLKQLTFQRQLGSMHDKTLRVSHLANFISQSLGWNSALAHRAALLSRCDLMTETVFEFPEMQGIMGQYQAIRDDEPNEVSEALHEFYLPRFSGDHLPKSRAGISISLADKIDTIVGIFAIGQRPTGERDPYALRRAAIAVLRILIEQKIDLDLLALLSNARNSLPSNLHEQVIVNDVFQFMMDRLKSLYLEKGVSFDIFDAVAAIKPSHPLDFDRRIQAVAAFKKQPESFSLTSANKRIRNLLRRVETNFNSPVDPNLFQESAEMALYSELQRLNLAVIAEIHLSHYDGALSILSKLKSVIDIFFDQVMVVTDDIVLRNNRIAMLQDVSNLFLQIADISHLQVQS